MRGGLILGVDASGVKITKQRVSLLLYAVGSLPIVIITAGFVAILYGLITHPPAQSQPLVFYIAILVVVYAILMLVSALILIRIRKALGRMTPSS